MAYDYFSRNGQLLPIGEAVVPLSNVEYSYGFGVYETIRVSRGVAFFLDQHAQRLLASAAAIELPHDFTVEFVAKTVRELITKNQGEACNVKILLIGGPTAEAAQMYMLCLNPLFPDRKLYARGASAISCRYERPFPQAKTLNMLPSYMAYRQARQAGAYDALLVNQRGDITEGTRTNFFAIKDRVIFTPPPAEILPGVMRAAVLGVARDNGFEIVEQLISIDKLSDYDGAFLTSMSSKIMPLRAIDQHQWGSIPPALRELMTALDGLLDNLTDEV